MSNAISSTRHAALRLVRPEPVEPLVLAAFCGHCGHPPSQPDSSARVCVRCGLGLMLETVPEAVPTPGAPFVVLDGALTVCALSAAAERALATTEPHAVDRPVTELLVAADCEASDRMTLAGAVMRATNGAEDVVRVALRPSHTFGVFFEARVAACGPPSAALVVLA